MSEELHTTQVIALERIALSIATLNELLSGLNLSSVPDAQRHGLGNALDRLVSEVRLVKIRNTQPQPTTPHAS